MKYVIIIFSFCLSLNASVKKELTYSVSSSNDNFVDTLVIGTDKNNIDKSTGYFSYKYQDKSLEINTIFKTFIKRESDYGFYFQIPEINKLQHLKLFAPALYPRNLKVGETLEDIPLPKINNEKVHKKSLTFSKEEAGNFSELSPEEKAEFIQNLGKSISQENEFDDEKIELDNTNEIGGAIDIIADYKVLDNIYYDNPTVKDYVTVIESTSRSPKGEFKSVYYYHNSIGFVYLTFIYEKVKYEVELINIDKKSIED